MKIIVICNLRFRSNFPEHDGLRISDLVKEPPHCFQSNFGPSTLKHVWLTFTSQIIFYIQFNIFLEFRI